MTETPRVDTDLLVLFAFVVAATVALLVPGVPQPIEWLVGIPLVLVVPGYAILLAVFPGGITGGARSEPDEPGVAAIAAVVVITSVVAVSIVGVLLSLVGSFQLWTIVLSIDGVTVAGLVVAVARRQRLSVHLGTKLHASRSGRSLSNRLGLSRAQTITLVVATVALLGALVVSGATPAQETGFSEASLLAGSDTEELLGANGPVTLVEGENNEIHLRLENHEGDMARYTVIGEMQRIGPNGTVMESQTVDASRISVADGDTVVVTRQVYPMMSGDRLRLRYLVYRGSAPDDPQAETADLLVRHWVDVVDGGSE